jgi:uroporphyrinogen-III synthase
MSALDGRRVVVTRAADQADELVALLSEAGATAVVVPLIEIVVEPAGVSALSALRPRDFDWLVVTSPNGAASYLTAHAHSPVSVAAVGTTTAAALANGGVMATLVPTDQRAGGLLAVFPAGAGQVLLVQAVDAEPTLASGLADLGWQVTTICPYRSVPAHPDARQQLAALSADAVLFASGSAARAWVGVFGNTTPPLVVAIGPQTAAVAQQVGLKVSLIAADHSVPGLVAALDNHLTGTK